MAAYSRDLHINILLDLLAQWTQWSLGQEYLRSLTQDGKVNVDTIPGHSRPCPRAGGKSGVDINKRDASDPHTHPIFDESQTS